MRLKNHEVQSIRETGQFVLRDDEEHGTIVLEIQALPPDFDEETEEQLPTPQPKRLGPERDKKGRVVLGTDGKPVIRYDESDSAYRESRREHTKLQAVKIVLDGVRPGQMEFSTAKPEGGDWPAFYRDALLEMKAFGFSLGDILDLVKAITNLSNIGEEEVKRAEEVFFEAAS